MPEAERDPYKPPRTYAIKFHISDTERAAALLIYNAREFGGLRGGIFLVDEDMVSLLDREGVAYEKFEHRGSAYEIWDHFGVPYKRPDTNAEQPAATSGF